MADVVVTVPKWLWSEWLAEGDLAGEVPTGHPTGERGAGEYIFYLSQTPGLVKVGDRLYIVAHNKLRGYAPITRIVRGGLIRGGGAVAVTIDEEIVGFQGFRYRWWQREIEKPFPDWRVP